MMGRFTSARSVNTVRHGWSLVKNKRTLWQMLREAMSGKYRMSFYTTIVLVLGAIYVVSPFDLIPDWIPVIGWIDDGIVVYLVIKRLNMETMRYMRSKAMDRKHIEVVGRSM